MPFWAKRKRNSLLKTPTQTCEEAWAEELDLDPQDLPNLFKDKTQSDMELESPKKEKLPQRPTRTGRAVKQPGWLRDYETE